MCASILWSNQNNRGAFFSSFELIWLIETWQLAKIFWLLQQQFPVQKKMFFFDSSTSFMNQIRITLENAFGTSLVFQNKITYKLI